MKNKSPSAHIFITHYLKSYVLAIFSVYESFVRILIGMKNVGHTITNEVFFDTIKVKVNGDVNTIRDRAHEKEINLQYYDKDHASIPILDYYNHSN